MSSLMHLTKSVQSQVLASVHRQLTAEMAGEVSAQEERIVLSCLSGIHLCGISASSHLVSLVSI